jgi:hypothetical protein
MVGALGVLSVGPAATTTEVVGDVDGAPWGVLPVGPVAATIEVVGDVDGKPPWGVVDGFDSGHH